MLDVLRYAGGLLGVVLALAWGASPVVAAMPEGPRLAIVADRPLHGGSAVLSVGPLGGAPMTLVDDPDFWGIGDRISWSAAGDLLAFSVSGSFHSNPPRAFGDGWPELAVAKADGSGSQVFLSAFLNGGDPVMAPDGTSVAFQRIKLAKVLPGRENYIFKSSIWTLDLQSGLVKRRTRWWTEIFFEPSSFLPDGSVLAATSFGRRGLRAVAVDLRSGRVSLLARAAEQPAYSPDGSKVAFLRWKHSRNGGHVKGRPPIYELRVARVNSIHRSHRLLRRREVLAWPNWDPSSNRLAFTASRVVKTGHSNSRNADRVMAINTDGTCLTRVFTDPDLRLYGAAWQPGPSREAGRIAC